MVRIIVTIYIALKGKTRISTFTESYMPLVLISLVELDIVLNL